MKLQGLGVDQLCILKTPLSNVLVIEVNDARLWQRE